MSIKSKSFNYGNEKEANWPPRFPPKRNAGRFYWDKEAQEFKEGNPPNTNNHFGTAPQVIFDSMPPQYHEGECRTIESRQEWERANKAHGMISFSSHDEVKKHTKRGIKGEDEALKKDRRNAARAARDVWKSDPRQARQKLNKQAERQIDTLKKSGIDLSDSGITIKD